MTAPFGKKRYWASRNLDDVKPITKFMDKDKIDWFTQNLDALCLTKKVVSGGYVDMIYYETEAPDEN